MKFLITFILALAAFVIPMGGIILWSMLSDRCEKKGMTPEMCVEIIKKELKHK